MGSAKCSRVLTQKGSNYYELLLIILTNALQTVNSVFSVVKQTNVAATNQRELECELTEHSSNGNPLK